MCDIQILFICSLDFTDLLIHFVYLMLYEHTEFF